MPDVVTESTDIGTPVSHYTLLDYITGIYNDGYPSADPDVSNKQNVGIGLAVIGGIFLFLLLRRR